MVGGNMINKMAELDVAFSTLISNIKSCALESMSRRADRQTVAAWINKLCESVSSETEKRNRNLYAQILMKMLRRSKLKKPFTDKPLSGKLPTIPVYMSDYLDETDYGGGEDVPPLSEEPMWMVANDDSMFLNSFTLESTAKDAGMKKDGRKTEPFKDESEYFRMPEADELEFYLSSHERNIENTATKRNLKEKSDAKNLVVDLDTKIDENDDLGTKEFGAFGGDDSYLFQKFDDIAKDIRYPVLKKQLRSDDSVLRERDLEKKLEVLGKKIEDESSKIQSQQDAMVKNILDRKNNEMSEIKNAYQRKINELETVINSRDETISTLNQKLNDVEKRHSNELQRITDSVKQKELETKSKKSIRDNELSNKINDLNLEITNLKRSHFETVEKLNIENEKYVTKCKEKMANENKKLKENITKLTENIQIIEEIKNDFGRENENCLTREKDYVATIKKLEDESSQQRGNLSCLDNEVVQLTNEKQSLERKIEELEQSGLQSEKMISTLQTKIKEFKSGLDSLTSCKQAELKEVKLHYKEKIIEMESSYKKRMTSLQNEFKAKNDETKKQISHLSHDNEVKRKEIEFLKGAKCKLFIEAKQSLDLMKRKCDEKYFVMYEQFNVKMNTLQSALHICREKLKLQKENIAQNHVRERKNYADYKKFTDDTQTKLVAKHNLDLLQLTEKIVRQKREYEEKMKGMLPLHVKRELEETIDAMKEQIGFLQSQSDLLQEELTSVTALNQSYRSTTPLSQSHYTSGMSNNRLIEQQQMVCE